jgi:hypothetical protein
LKILDNAKLQPDYFMPLPQPTVIDGSYSNSNKNALGNKIKVSKFDKHCGKKDKHFIGECCFETSPASRKLYASRVRKGTCRYTSDLSTPE